MITGRKLFGMLDRFVEAVETMRKSQKRYEMNQDENTLSEKKDSEKRLDDMCFNYMKWKRKNEKFLKGK